VSVLPALLFGSVLAWAWSAAPATLPRGPYLQSPTSTGITVVFRTSSSTATTLRYGTRMGPPWDFTKSDSSATNHVFTLTGLRPETRYYYEISAGSSVLSNGKDHTFRTSPPENSRAPLRFVAFGDSGTGSSSQIDVAHRMEEVVPCADFALGLGDLVYDNGAASDFDPLLFRPYAELFRRTAFWPTIGNHDARSSNGAPFYDAFYLPTNTGAPGHPSNTERYYSFDQGMAHFVCLDSETSDSSPGSAMYDWLSDDLDNARSRGKRWMLAFLHHPPYSEGTHNSSEGDLTAVRENLVPLLEQKGVDMLLAGHSHVYERSFLAKNNRILQNSTGDYSKIGSPDGTIYLVSGCGGKTGSGSLDQALMAESKGNVAGFNVIDVSWNELRGSFVERDGETTDLFVVRKANDTVAPYVAATSTLADDEIELVFDEPVRAGTSGSGAENVAHYNLIGGGTVVDATLDSDQRTVTLTTTALTPGRAGLIVVAGVADTAGNLAPEQRAYFALAGDGTTPPGGGTTTAVPRGATWRYAKGTSTPPSSWASRSFDDSSWSQGRAGFGYEDGDDATVLSDMLDGYATLYVRTRFDVASPAAVTGMTLNVSYDDGFVAFLNGVEVARANVPQGQNSSTLAVTGHEAGTFEGFDLAAFRSALVAGSNVLAVEGHNGILSSNDFSLHPELVLGGGSGGGSGSGTPPVAVFDCDIESANSPALVSFDATRSFDPDGALARTIWDFGDGTRTIDPTPQHLYEQDGIYLVTLIVRDAERLDSMEQRTLRVHSEGQAPFVRTFASHTTAAPGSRIDFTSTGTVDPDGGTLSYQWSFGDPESGADNAATEPDGAHAFAKPGTYPVTLTVTDDEGASSTQTVVITIR